MAQAVSQSQEQERPNLGLYAAAATKTTDTKNKLEAEVKDYKIMKWFDFGLRICSALVLVAMLTCGIVYFSNCSQNFFGKAEVDGYGTAAFQTGLLLFFNGYFVVRTYKTSLSADMIKKFQVAKEEFRKEIDLVTSMDEQPVNVMKLQGEGDSELPSYSSAERKKKLINRLQARGHLQYTQPKLRTRRPTGSKAARLNNAMEAGKATAASFDSPSSSPSTSSSQGSTLSSCESAPSSCASSLSIGIDTPINVN